MARSHAELTIALQPSSPRVRWRADLSHITQGAFDELAQKQGVHLFIAISNPSAYDEIVNAHAFDFEPIVI
jgi:hypothetical protein